MCALVLAFLNKGYVPLALKEAIVCPILKKPSWGPKVWAIMSFGGRWWRRWSKFNFRGSWGKQLFWIHFSQFSGQHLYIGNIGCICWWPVVKPILRWYIDPYGFFKFIMNFRYHWLWYPFRLTHEHGVESIFYNFLFSLQLVSTDVNWAGLVRLSSIL